MKRFIKISQTSVVDRRKVAGLYLNLQTLKTLVFVIGVPSVMESDFSFDETTEMLETGEQHDFPKNQIV